MGRTLSLASVMLFSCSLFAADPFAGTWTLDLAKSQLAGPYANMKAEALTIQEQGDNLLIVANVTLADGSMSSFREVVAKRGGDLKYTEGSLPDGISRVMKRIDDRSISLTTMRGVEEIQVATNIVSKNGKELRITRRGMGTDGSSFESLEVLRRK